MSIGRGGLSQSNRTGSTCVVAMDDLSRAK